MLSAKMQGNNPLEAHITVCYSVYSFLSIASHFERKDNMKTLILYATKHGAAAEIAKKIADKIDGALIHDIKQPGVPSLADFDCIIFGSSLYAGAIRKEAKAFLKHNADALKAKKLGLFLSGMAANTNEGVFSTAFPENILVGAHAAAFLGGIFDPAKAGFFERMIMKAVTKKSEYMSTIDDEKITQFAESMLQ